MAQQKKRTEVNVQKTNIFRLEGRVRFLQMRTRACMHSHRIKIEMCNARIYLCITGMAHLRAENHFETSAYACAKSSSLFIKTILRRPRTHAENHHRIILFEESHLSSSRATACRRTFIKKPFFDVRFYMQKILILGACLAILLTLAPFYFPGNTKSSQKWLLCAVAVS